eukprot:Pgem_evm1s2152
MEANNWTNDPIRRFPRALTQYAFTSAIIVFVLRFYNFIEGMIKVMPNKTELSALFIYSFASFGIYLFFALMDMYYFKKVTIAVEFGIGGFESIIMLALFLVLAYRLRIAKQTSQAMSSIMYMINDVIFMSVIFLLLKIGASIYCSYIMYTEEKTNLFIGFNKHLVGAWFLAIPDAVMMFLVNIITARLGKYCALINTSSVLPTQNNTAHNTTKAKEKILASMDNSVNIIALTDSKSGSVVQTIECGININIPSELTEIKVYDGSN